MDSTKTRLSVGIWESLPSRKFIETAPGQAQQWGQPTPRAVCTIVSWGDGVYVFGGFDGTRRTNEFSEYSFQNKCWYAVKGRGIPPSPRDRHTAVVAGNMMYVFGGHDGDRRLGDTHAFDFVASRWLTLLSTYSPTARQSHCMATYKPPLGQGSERIYLFGGFDGSYRNDLHVLDLSTHQWSKVITTGNGPTPRYRSTMVCVCNVLVVFGGHDGSTFLNDVYVFHPDSCTWARIHATNLPPLPRDSHTAVAFGDSIVVFGGSSGAAMNDLHELTLTVSTSTTTLINSAGGNGDNSSSGGGGGGSSTSASSTPSITSTNLINGNNKSLNNTRSPSSEGDHPIQSNDLSKLLQQAISAADTNTISSTIHVGPESMVNNNYNVEIPSTLTNGTISTNSNTNSNTTTTISPRSHPQPPTFHATWSPLFPGGNPPHPRFCHAAVLFGNSRMIIFGGFDGKNRNYDLYQLKLSVGRFGARAEVPLGTLMTDLNKLVGNETLADVFFVVDGGQRIPGHRLLLNRIPFFAKLFGGASSNGNGNGNNSCEQLHTTIEIKSIDQDTILNIIRYAYTDECDLSSKSLVCVFQAAERFGIERLKAMCENAMLDSLDANNASSLFASADKYGASNLRALAFNYIISNFDQVSITSDFEEMGRSRVDLVFEVLKRRGAAVKVHQ
jgi:N-acetylneuraminic acid mutarotase